MRVTDNLRFESFKNSIAALKERIDKNQEMLSSGKKITKPSDDPVIVSQAMQLETQKSMDDQYSRNLSRLKMFGSMYETSLNSIQEALSRAKQLAVSEGSDTVDVASREAAAEEVKGIIEQLVSVGNTKVGSTYIFGGKKSGSPAFTLDENTYSVTFNGTSDVPDVYVSDSQKIKMGISGVKFFDSSGGSDIFATLNNLKTALETNDAASIKSSIDTIDGAIDLTANNLSYVGTYTSQIEDRTTILEAKNTQLTEIISNMTDADMVDLISQYNLLSTAYQASLSAMSKLQQLNILNYL